MVAKGDGCPRSGHNQGTRLMVDSRVWSHLRFSLHRSECDYMMPAHDSGLMGPVGWVAAAIAPRGPSADPYTGNEGGNAPHGHTKNMPECQEMCRGGLEPAQPQCLCPGQAKGLFLATGDAQIPLREEEPSRWTCLRRRWGRGEAGPAALILPGFNINQSSRLRRCQRGGAGTQCSMGLPHRLPRDSAG